ncbi:MAG TPA: glycoside hydrolase family 16 protein [Acidimicrobiia bacterium]|nr:glycoside hydrolase family 16 protein [Acidimicrobiia bacterium]
MTLHEDFSSGALDETVWFPYYLPHWSSRSEAAATFDVSSGALHLSIPPEQPLWCPDRHEEPMKVSCIQTGSFSGAVGSTIGQQPFREGLTVREEQPEFWGYTPHHGRITVRMRGSIGPRSMFAFWMSGIEDRPERSGEICVAEIFGSGLGEGTAEIGIGVHRFRDPSLNEEFSAQRFEIDVTRYHSYAVDWRSDGLTFLIDDHVVRRSVQSPDYPMQLMIGVFHFPSRPPDATDAVEPAMWVDEVVGTD